MLVLSRRPGESVRVGDEIKITLISVSPGQVRIGIVAPPRIGVHREEIYTEIAAANRVSASAGLEELGLAVEDVEEASE